MNPGASGTEDEPARDDGSAQAPRAELAALVAGLRAHLQHRARSGLAGLPAGPTPRRAAAPPREVAERPDATERRAAAARALQVLREEIGDCQRCKLAPTRTKLVFGVGDPGAEILFAGEGPGADEDRVGEPFVGAAGQLLDRMIVAMGLRRDEVYICNVVKCRPPGNRNPEPDEVAQCAPFLRRQIEAVRPRVIVALGKFAAHTLCRETTPITKLRGQLRSFEGIPVMPTYHPAYLLRNPAGKRDVWEDLQSVLRLIGRAPPRGRRMD